MELSTLLGDVLLGAVGALYIASPVITVTFLLIGIFATLSILILALYPWWRLAYAVLCTLDFVFFVRAMRKISNKPPAPLHLWLSCCLSFMLVVFACPDQVFEYDNGFAWLGIGHWVLNDTPTTEG